MNQSETNVTYEEWISQSFRYTDKLSSLSSIEPEPPGEILAHCLRFFTSGPASLAGIPRANACAGLWSIPGIEGWLGVLGDQSLPFDSRAELADAHYQFFHEVFFGDDYDGASFIWWELLIGASYGRWDAPSICDDHAMCRRLVSVIERILYIPSTVCQYSALHGVNEICFRRPGDEEADGGRIRIIRQFLKSGRCLSAAIRDYAITVELGQAQ